jgi:N-acetylmuramoyl-L-alanine amidase
MTLKKGIIVIDEGHDEHDPGAVNSTYGYREEDTTEVIGGKTIFYLQKQGYTTINSREILKNDPWEGVLKDLKKRVRIVNTSGAACLVSIHINSEPTKKAQYISIWIQAAGGLAEILASCINNKLKTIPWPNVGVRIGNYLMNRETFIPSCIVEAGFISNDYEAKRLQDDDMRDRFASLIAQGIDDFMQLIGEG